MKQLFHLFSTLAISMLLAACGTDSSSSGSAAGADTSATGGVTVSGASDTRPAFSLRLTDAPVDDLVAVVMRFTAVQVRNVNGNLTTYSFDTPRSIDLLELQGSKTADLLVNMPLDDGDYNQIHLFVDDAPMATHVDLGAAGVANLAMWGSSRNGIKVNGVFSVTGARKASLVIDFDLRKSVKYNRARDEYSFHPKLRLIESAGSGHIRGVVDAALLTSAECSDNDVDTYNAAYVFNGHNALLEDIDESSNNIGAPVTTTAIRYDSETSTYRYEAAFLPGGKYTVALTCNADLEDLEDDDDTLRFFGTRNATVMVNDIVFL